MLQYSDFKEKSAYHMDLPDTSILCLCKNEIDMSYGTEASRTAPVETPQENVAGIGWFRSLIRRFTGPVQAPPTPPPSRGKVSCKQCQVSVVRGVVRDLARGNSLTRTH